MKTKMVGLALAIMVTVTSCAAALEEFNDAPVSGNNDEPAMRISFPDGFGNVAAKCDGPNMVYSAMNSNGRGVAVVANDPRCS